MTSPTSPRGWLRRLSTSSYSSPSSKSGIEILVAQGYAPEPAERALRFHNGDVSKAAAALEHSRHTSASGRIVRPSPDCAQCNNYAAYRRRSSAAAVRPAVKATGGVRIQNGSDAAAVVSPPGLSDMSGSTQSGTLPAGRKSNDFIESLGSDASDSS